MIQAQIASALHRFSDARHYLAQASLGGAPSADVKRVLLNVDQACGSHLDEVLDERRRIVAKSGRFVDRVALGALLADLGEFDEADDIYRQALREIPGCFAVPGGLGLFSTGHAVGRTRSGTRTGARRALVSQGGRQFAVLCAERACTWRKFFRPRGGQSDAEATLRPALASGDPEVSWRLADVLKAAGSV